MNKVYAIIGPPASGKSAIATALASFGVPEIISHTNRKPHKGELHGKNYYFVSDEEFSKIDLVERVMYADNLYGLSKKEVMSKINNNPISFVVVDRPGFEQLQKLLGTRIESIFIMVDENTIIYRIMAAGNDPKTIRTRIDYAKSIGEFNNWDFADYVVKNTKSLDVSVRQVLAIMNLPVPCTNPL